MQTNPATKKVYKQRANATIILTALLALAGFIWNRNIKTPKQANPSQLEQIIPAEVKDDAFYQAIYRLAKQESIHTILEIGSSSGDGSTDAFVKAIQENPHHPTLFCMEMSRVRFDALAERYQKEKNVKCYNVSSVPIESFPSESEIAHFHREIPSTLSQIPLSVVLAWLRQDLAYLRDHTPPQRGIELIKKENGIELFDMVLIDGSEFTGKAELELVYGARYLLLDDVASYKNHENRQRLLKDPSYELIEENLSLRNGYSIFKKLSYSKKLY